MRWLARFFNNNGTARELTADLGCARDALWALSFRTRGCCESLRCRWSEATSAGPVLAKDLARTATNAPSGKGSGSRKGKHDEPSLEVCWDWQGSNGWKVGGVETPWRKEEAGRNHEGFAVDVNTVNFRGTSNRVRGLPQLHAPEPRLV